eukprot:13702939-Ditylum_brightwellii.AAC.1
MFPEKAGQTQKRYIQRNIRYSRETGYLKDFPTTNGNPTQPLKENELLDILKYGVPASWHREFMVQGVDPVDQGLQKCVDFCTRLEWCEPSKGKAKGEKPSNQNLRGNVRPNFQHCLPPQQVKGSSTAKCTDKITLMTRTIVLN